MRLVDFLVKEGLVAQNAVKYVDAADFQIWMDDFDKNLESIKDGVLIINNVQKLLPGGDATDVNDIDRLFARMRNDAINMPIVMMTGLRRGFEEFLAKNQEVASLFEFRFDLKAFDEQALCDVCVSSLSQRYKLDISRSHEETAWPF